MAIEDRWPPIYDFEQLAATIRDLVEKPQDPLGKRMYVPAPSGTDFLQGDVIELDCEVPFIGAAGAAEVQDAPPFWSVLGNTCDLAKPVSDHAYTQLVPVWAHGQAARLKPATLVTLARYKYYTQFYLPPWNQTTDGLVHVADFMRPVSVHKLALQQATLVARMTRQGWILFHSCVVRFLARDDGRND